MALDGRLLRGGCSSASLKLRRISILRSSRSERSRMEMGGVEPPSARMILEASTCVAYGWFLTRHDLIDRVLPSQPVKVSDGTAQTTPTP